jgi:DNA-binding XRE family transcriptional regulator
LRKELKEARESLGLTQAALADKIGMTPNGYRLIESGKKDGSVKAWRRIASELKLSDARAWRCLSGK